YCVNAFDNVLDFMKSLFSETKQSRISKQTNVINMDYVKCYTGCKQVIIQLQGLKGFYFHSEKEQC
ncbi:hypothetical protein STEG23_016894, partial [Scotinomys teguina]